jgi:glycosyltransferase involved in cell wall biosynthesis
VGSVIQRACARIPQRAFCYSQLHAGRLHQEGLRGEIQVIRGLYAGAVGPRPPSPGTHAVVFVGRHIPEKRVPALVRALVDVRRNCPELTCDIYGDGPERAQVEELVTDLRLNGVVTLHGFVHEAVIDEALSCALCLVLPSKREGYGLVVLEAAARGTPSVVVRETDNAAVELVVDGVNGIVARSAKPSDLASAILEVHRRGRSLRASTAAWFDRNASELTLEGSLERVVKTYEATRNENRPQ